MTKIYACLVGNWVCLNDDPDCVIGDNLQSPSLWWKEGADAYVPASRDKTQVNSFYSLDYVKLTYKGKGYRINPIFIQVVTE